MSGYVAVFAGYLLGSIPFGYLVSKYWKGINILEHGSGNIGFTNVLRTLGWPPAAVVLAGDISKGSLAAWLGLYTGGEVFGIICGLAALIGHSFSVFLKFRGGKLVASGFGVLLMLVPEVALTALATWLAVVFLTRYVSLASITASGAMFLSVFLFHESAAMKIFGAVAAVFVILRHRSNIKRLLKGEETKISRKNR
ncbi:glycerol-3-phosphate 1-O-acyltransferase PlsY [Phosphitispora fastidiosa]|uniref:glycerol-3-phosphate 1-O-acyltransferase PlsY n=1 Tax=Phosphitispora fastidiosa TaxID=2837202 RepID=UPI001E49D21C|nr:glycerol-3-phosphate 1-O-acyltransferase PlsY [Phosphitispora fastidiosa]MBU7005543.1 glycerol-3-phosphate acyltransferase PlsY [Phosphitispora fastidiosa]